MVAIRPDAYIPGILLRHSMSDLVCLLVLAVLAGLSAAMIAGLEALRRKYAK